METPQSCHYVFCLLPPGNVIREIALVQERLFSAHQNPSFRAIPPIIPVCGLSSPALPSGFPRLPAVRVRPTEYTIERRALFLKVEPLEGSAEPLIRTARECGSEAMPLFPPVFGFFLGAEYDGPEMPSHPSSLGFTTAPVESRILTIEHTESGPWYTGLVWKLEGVV